MGTNRTTAAILTAVMAGTAAGQDWVGTWDGPEGQEDQGSCIAVNPSGQIAVTGLSRFAASGYDIATLMFDAAGNLAWEAQYAGAGGGTDKGINVDFDSAGNVIVSGTISGAGSPDMVILKYDPTGTLLWDSIYDGPGAGSDFTDAYSMALDSADNIYFCGATDVGAGDFDGVVLKYAPDGALSWSRIQSGIPGGFDVSWVAALDTADCLHVGGSTETATSEAMMASKYDPNGNLLWQSIHEDPAGSQGPYGIAVDGAGNALLGGIITPPGAEEDVVLVKFDSVGTFQWSRSYDGPTGGSDLAFVLQCDDAGNAYLGGYSEETIDTQALTLKYDSSGNLLWSHRYDPSPYWGGDSSIVALHVDNKGDVWATGWMYVDPTVGFDATTLLFSPKGALLTAMSYNGPVSGNDYAFGSALDDDGNLYMVGTTLESGANLDVLVVRHDNPFLHLDITPSSVNPGDLLQITCQPGTPGGLALLAAVDISGTPLFLPVQRGRFDSAGRWDFTATIPSGLSGLEVTFLGFGVDSWGQVVATNSSAVSFL